ncbi:hypothetical protein [Gordonia sp. 852002-51296_SCH5728562-b]|uniref:hypothetical protein n=1 Tax=Gordonia sp. 852002-51296_SCH5728562-b TaxID=1834101 RepID=UPI0007EB8611|nr:hypothetical protein [Gordonia sp. 852002-51296_SCH5728562-b]OBA39004.1 hypothetical protein A5766_04420 [Gordonia sp. 852002-51296_SCH5728562-b]
MAMVLRAIDGVGRELRDVWEVAFKDGPPSPRALGGVAAILAAVVFLLLFEPGPARLVALGVVGVASLVVVIELWIESRRKRRTSKGDNENGDTK